MDLILTVRVFERALITACVPLLLFIGYRLFVLGATAQMQLSGRSTTWQGKLTNVSPGAFCFLLGAILGGLIFKSPVTSSLSGGTATEKTAGGEWVAVAQKSEIPTVTFMGGSMPPLLSVKLRRYLSDLAACHGEGLAPEKCVQEVRGELNLSANITRQDLREIEELEAKAGSDEKAFEALKARSATFLANAAGQ